MVDFRRKCSTTNDDDCELSERDDTSLSNIVLHGDELNLYESENVAASVMSIYTGMNVCVNAMILPQQIVWNSVPIHMVNIGVTLYYTMANFACMNVMKATAP